MSSSSDWGRIADDGTVYVRTADGERAIGSWQAGDAEAGLAFYRLRYDDLVTEVQLLERRLASGAERPGARPASWPGARQGAAAAGVGDRRPRRPRHAPRRAARGRRGEGRARSPPSARRPAPRRSPRRRRWSSRPSRSRSPATSWKASGDRLRAIVDDWRAIKGVDRKTDDALWKRFAAARDAFGRRRGQHFATLDVERSTVKQAKERLIARAEELSTSEEWRDTTAAMRDLMTEWKAAGRAGRDVEDALWTRFRAAQDAFFARRSETFAERDAEQVENQRRKEEIIGTAEALDLRDTRAAQSALRDLQEQYDEVGHVPRDAMRRLDDRMQAAEQRVRDAVDAGWRQSAPAVEPVPGRAARAARRSRGEARTGAQVRRRRAASARPRPRWRSAARSFPTDARSR